MCGICGALSLDGEAPVPEEILREMNGVLSHRGPDGEGFFLRGPVGLGHRRLAIIDLVTGQQPMLSEDGSVALVFNGEIYNYRPLRDALRGLGHAFRTESDTEVILRAYQQWGEGCVPKLRGMFAFAIWDAPRRTLMLARDRVGIKPLYYAVGRDRFSFASEIKSLLRDPALGRELDPFALDEYLTYLYVPAPRSIFRSVRKLRPGHVLTVTPSGISEREYWDLAFGTSTRRTESEHAESLLAKLRESVDVHLMSDVPLGAFLSGGVDSSAVVGVMAGLVDRPVNTASIGFPDASFDELPYAREVARRFGTNAYEKTVDAHAATILDDLVWHYDEPFADSSMVPTYYVSQVARERVTVALSGDGGDENFAGYRRYRFDLFENRLRRLLPSWIRGPVFGALGRAYPKADWLPRPLRGKTLLTSLSVGAEEGYFRTMRWLDGRMKRELYDEPFRRQVGDHEASSVLRSHFDRVPHLDPLSRVQYVDVKTYLVDDILTKVDRASMAHSLEVRVPLLDHEFMELAASIPANLKLRNGEGKYIFKKSLEGLLPRDVLYRTKMGFSIPLADWLRGELKPLFEERVLARDAFVRRWFHREPMVRWWGQHQARVRDFAYPLWALLVLESWGRRFVGGGR